MKLKDFDLSFINNVYQDTTETEISDAIEYVAETLPDNSAVFIVDDDGNMIVMTKEESEEKMDFETFINADGSKNYKVVVCWIQEFIQEHNFKRYGLIVETASGFQVVK